MTDASSHRDILHSISINIVKDEPNPLTEEQINYILDAPEHELPGLISEASTPAADQIGIAAIRKALNGLGGM